MKDAPDTDRVLAEFIKGYSAEVTTPDRASLDEAARLMPTAAPVYIAGLPKDSAEKQAEVAAQVRAFGLEPVPHIVARNLACKDDLDEVLGRLAERAQITRALVVGGDRDTPAGPYDSALQILETGALQAFGVRKVAFGAYPEGHPRIAAANLESALKDKLDAARDSGLDARLITQLCFDADAIIAFVSGLRERGIPEKVRVGVAGPAKRSTLLKYAMICGVGASVRAVREREGIAKNLLDRETPERLLNALALANAATPALGLVGVHFFTFAALKNTLLWAEQQVEQAEDRAATASAS